MASPEKEDTSRIVASTKDRKDASKKDQTMLLLARLMENGQEEDETCKDLDSLTKLLADDSEETVRASENPQPLHQLFDMDVIDSILGYLDMRQSPTIRGHATLTTSAYLKASDQKGVENLSRFFTSRVGKGTYDDLVLAFSVASSIFPVVPDAIAALFLTDGFVPSLGPLMKRKWKSRKVEQAALELLNVACMNSACREAIRKYCSEWLEDMVAENPADHAHSHVSDRVYVVEDGAAQKIHSEGVRNMAAVILAKLQVGDYPIYSFFRFFLHFVAQVCMSSLSIFLCLQKLYSFSSI